MPIAQNPVSEMPPKWGFNPDIVPGFVIQDISVDVARDAALKNEAWVMLDHLAIPGGFGYQ